MECAESHIDLEKIAARVREILPPTACQPITTPEGLTLWVKREDQQPVHCFKARNGLAGVLAAQAQGANAVWTVSSGSHAIGLAWGAKMLGMEAAAVVPVGSPQSKIAFLRTLGARVVVAGADYDDALESSLANPPVEGVFVASTNHSAILRGAQTLAEECAEQGKWSSAVVSIGGGSHALGFAQLRRSRKEFSGFPLIGVQAAGASAFHDSWHRRVRITHSAVSTKASGLAVRSTYDTFEPLLDGLDDVVLVSDHEMRQARLWLWEALPDVSPLLELSAVAGIAVARRLEMDHALAVLTGANGESDSLL